MTNESDTPRTDEDELDRSYFAEEGCGTGGPSGYCTSYFARTLERELSAARQRVAELEAELATREGLYREEWNRATAAESRLAETRLATIEECAKVCEDTYSIAPGTAVMHMAASHCASAIRQLKEKS